MGPSAEARHLSGPERRVNRRGVWPSPPPTSVSNPFGDDKLDPCQEAGVGATRRRFDGATFVEFPEIDGRSRDARGIATGSGVPCASKHAFSGGDLDTAVPDPKTIDTLGVPVARPVPPAQRPLVRKLPPLCRTRRRERRGRWAAIPGRFRRPRAGTCRFPARDKAAIRRLLAVEATDRTEARTTPGGPCPLWLALLILLQLVALPILLPGRAS